MLDHGTGTWCSRQRLGSRIALSADSGATDADRPLKHGDRIEFGPRWLSLCATPGHTAGYLSCVLDDLSRAFTGDRVLIRGCGRTDFKQGGGHTLFASVHERIVTSPQAYLLSPAPDYCGLTVTSVGEERAFNPRAGGKAGKADFVGFMDNLGLRHPKQNGRAVPANLRCDEPASSLTPPAKQAWANLHCIFGGP